jgi:hypothetical protein
LAVVQAAGERLLAVCVPRTKKAKAEPPTAPAKPGPLSGALFFAPPAPPPPPGAVKEKPPREKKPKAKNDPRLVTAARELRDRWLEQVNGGAHPLEARGRYDVARLAAGPSGASVPLLPAA